MIDFLPSAMWERGAEMGISVQVWFNVLLPGSFCPECVKSRRKRGGSNTVPALWQVFRPPKNPGKCCSVAEVKHLVVQERISKVK